MNIKKRLTAICLTALTAISSFSVLGVSARSHIVDLDSVTFEYGEDYAKVTNNTDETRLIEVTIDVHSENTGNFIASVRASKVCGKGESVEIRNKKYTHFSYAQLPWFTVYNGSCYASGTQNHSQGTIIKRS